MFFILTSSWFENGDKLGWANLAVNYVLQCITRGLESLCAAISDELLVFSAVHRGIPEKQGENRAQGVQVSKSFFSTVGRGHGDATYAISSSFSPGPRCKQATPPRG